jgi:hypothetical protein
MESTREPDRRWARSSFSVADNDCVEVCCAGVDVFVRDSKNPGGPTLRFSRPEWAAFAAGVKAGEFDLSTDSIGERGQSGPSPW